MKFFSTAGPVRPEDHYYLPLETRLDKQELRLLIQQKKYFILHAPRQTGKTSTMLNFAQQLNTEGIYTALHVNVESAQAARSNYLKGMATILEEFLNQFKNQLPDEKKIINYLLKEIDSQNFSGSSLKSMLQCWAQNSAKPIILLIDEIDALVGDTLISVLRQLRSGYPDRPQAFPQTVCLIGVRDVRDYRIWSDDQQAMILGGPSRPPLVLSASEASVSKDAVAPQGERNIWSESIRLKDFTKQEVQDLYEQHTQTTGQKFEQAAIDCAFELSQGQPWLVNALAYQACFKDVTDYTKAITKEMIESAKETLIKRRDTHIDALVDKLQEPRVRSIIDAIIT